MTKAQIQKVIDVVERLARQLEDEANETQEKFDNLSDKAQEGNKGQSLESQYQALESAYDYLGSCVASLNDAFDAIE